MDNKLFSTSRRASIVKSELTDGIITGRIQYPLLAATLMLANEWDILIYVIHSSSRPIHELQFGTFGNNIAY